MTKRAPPKWESYMPLPSHREDVGTIWRTLDGRLIATLMTGEGIELPPLADGEKDPNR